MTDMLSNLIKALSDFISRDIMYLVGGGSIFVTLYYVSEQSLPNDYPAPMWLLAAGMAYGTGYAIQEILCLFPFLTTAPVFSPGRFTRWLYRRFTLDDWRSVERSDWEMNHQRFYVRAKDRNFAEYQRILALMQIGSTLGANWLVCSIILWIYAGLHAAKCQFTLTEIVLASSTLGLSLGLISTCWIKGLQQIKYILDWNEWSQTDESGE